MMAKDHVLKISLVLISVVGNVPFIEAASSLKKLLIEPSTSDTYSGQGKLYRVTFANIQPNRLVEAFPEPPMTITNLKNNSKCNCDGGIWERDKVYLTENERLLIIGSYSGSNSYFEFYDTASCNKIKEIDALDIEILHSVNFKSTIPEELIQYVGQ